MLIFTCIHYFILNECKLRLVLGCLQVTYPLDTLRLRIAVDPGMRGIRGASTALFREGSYNAFFRGLTASLIGALPAKVVYGALLCPHPTMKAIMSSAPRWYLASDCYEANID